MNERWAISGVVPVINTPFDDDDRIDHTVLAREIDWAFEQGADGICAGAPPAAPRRHWHGTAAPAGGTALGSP